MFDLKTLSEKAEILKVQIKDTELRIKSQQELAAVIDRESERHAIQLQSAHKRVSVWDAAHTNDLIVVHQQIKNLETIDVAEQKLVLDELQKHEKLLEAIIDDYEHWKSVKTTAADVIKEKKHELKHLDGGKCPYCKQGFEISQTKRNVIETSLDSAEEQYLDACKKVDTIDKTIKKLTAEYKIVKAKLKVKDLEELLQLDNKIKQLNDKLFEYQTAVNPYIEALDELQSVVLGKKDPTILNELKILLDHQTFLLKILTKKDSFVRKALLNKNIPFLNKRLQTYLTDLGLPHTVEFTHEMTASITQFGHPMDFGNLSNGQRARVNLALSFAFRDVLQSMHDHVNICLLDEVLDVGLDTVGVQAAARMLKCKARDEKLALYIISHRDEIDSAFDRKLVVQLSGGFSSLRYEEE